MHAQDTPEEPAILSRAGSTPEYICDQAPKVKQRVLVRRGSEPEPRTRVESVGPAQTRRNSSGNFAVYAEATRGSLPEQRCRPAFGGEKTHSSQTSAVSQIRRSASSTIYPAKKQIELEELARRASAPTGKGERHRRAAAAKQTRLEPALSQKSRVSLARSSSESRATREMVAFCEAQKEEHVKARFLIAKTVSDRVSPDTQIKCTAKYLSSQSIPPTSLHWLTPSTLFATLIVVLFATFFFALTVSKRFSLPSHASPQGMDAAVPFPTP